MNSLTAILIVPLILSAFVYLALIIPVEMFKPRSATVRLKRRLFAFSLVASYVAMFVGCGVKVGGVAG